MFYSLFVVLNILLLFYSYKHPQFAINSDEALAFLAGSYNFKTSEIEVFTKD